MRFKRMVYLSKIQGKLTAGDIDYDKFINNITTYLYKTGDITFAKWSSFDKVAAEFFIDALIISNIIGYHVDSYGDRWVYYIDKYI